MTERLDELQGDGSDAEGRGRRGGRRRDRRQVDRRPRVAGSWRARWRSSCASRSVLHERVIGQDDAVAAVAERDPPLARRARPTRTGRSARSCSSAPPVSARPSSRARSPTSCSTTSGRWCASTCRSTWRSTRCRASSARRRATSATRRAASSPRRCAAGPYAVVLLDEIEKAHPDVFNVLLQLHGRRPPHRRPGPHGRLHQHRADHDVATSARGGDEAHGDGRGAQPLQARVPQPHRRDRRVPPARRRPTSSASSTSRSSSCATRLAERGLGLELTRRGARRGSRRPATTPTSAPGRSSGCSSARSPTRSRSSC